MNRILLITIKVLKCITLLWAVGNLPGTQAALAASTLNSTMNNQAASRTVAAATEAGGVSTVNPLEGTGWRLEEFQSMDDTVGTVRPADGSLFTMRLHGDGTATMQLDCNRATGRWQAKPGVDGSSGSFTFGKLASTRTLCPPPNLDEKIMAQAEYVRSFLLKDGRLYLSLLADGGIFVWEPDKASYPAGTLPAAPERGGPRNWVVTGVSRKLNLREMPSSQAKTIASYAPGTILDNLGCQRANGGIWCDVQPLGGGPRGYVFSEFLKPAVSPDGSVAIGEDDSALRAGQGRFDATGKISCTESSGQPISQCEFGVARAGGGYATVLVKKPDGRQRGIYFRMGRPIGADISQADGYKKFKSTRENGLYLILIGDERYEIPDAVIFGG